MNASWSPVIARWRRLAALMGWPGWAGAALLLAAWALHGVWLPGLQAEHDGLQDQVSLQRQQLQAVTPASAQGRASAPQAATHEAMTGEQAWAQLWARLPDQALVPTRQAEVLQRATASGLRLDGVQFQGAPLRALPRVSRQQLSLPIQGSHPALMAWLAQVGQQPGWSVDALDISRDDVMSDQVKARVSLSLWTRHPDAMPPVAASAPRRQP